MKFGFWSNPQVFLGVFGVPIPGRAALIVADFSENWHMVPHPASPDEPGSQNSQTWRGQSQLEPCLPSELPLAPTCVDLEARRSPLNPAPPATYATQPSQQETGTAPRKASPHNHCPAVMEYLREFRVSSDNSQLHTPQQLVQRHLADYQLCGHRPASIATTSTGSEILFLAAIPAQWTMACTMGSSVDCP